jgi:hypothetical protein
MNIDDTTRRIIKETKIYIEEKFPIEISEEEITDIVDSQFRGLVYGLKKGISIKLPVIGRFLYIDKSRILEEVRELNRIKDFYSEIEFEQKELENKIAYIKRNKERWKKERETKLTVIDVVRKPNLSNGHIIYDKLSKLIEQENGE